MSSSITQLSLAVMRDTFRSSHSTRTMLALFVLMLGLLWCVDLLLTVPGETSSRVLHSSLGVVTSIGFMSVAFLGTTVPIVAQRQRGTLRVLGTTPLRRSSYLCAQLPTMAAVAAFEALIVLALVLALQIADFSGLVRLAFTMVLGYVLFASFALLLATRMTNASLALQLSAIMPALIIFTSGTALPLELYPEMVRAVIPWLPTSWFLHALDADLTGTAATTLPVTTLWLLMAVASLIIGGLATQLFRWAPRETP